jgi:hypothetical protein
VGFAMAAGQMSGSRPGAVRLNWPHLDASRWGRPIAHFSVVTASGLWAVSDQRINTLYAVGRVDRARVAEVRRRRATWV